MRSARSTSVPSGFTIVELLVVITIIVVLLALLAPALDKAIYQAELAMCGSNQRQTATGLYVYAMDHRRWYPPRRMTGNDTPSQLMRNGVTGEDDPGLVSNTSNTDLRPSLKGYVDLKLLLEPLAKPVDLSTTQSNRILLSYALWTGFTILDEDKGMKRIGDRVTYSGRDFPGQAPVELDLVLGDWAEWSKINNNAFIRNAHPDGEGKMSPFLRQDEHIDNSIAMGGVNSGGPYTESYWFNDFQTYAPGPFDLNFTQGDGSVQRLNVYTEDDEDTVKMPDWPDRAETGRGSVVPAK